MSTRVISTVSKITGLLLWRSALAIAVAALISGCSPQTFQPATAIQQQQAPGNYLIPPKVDILLATDNTGSMTDSYDEISRKVRGFLKDLSAQNWDYHFANIPLTTSRNINQVAASRFDPNYMNFGLWEPPFPGANPFELLGTVSTWAFRTPDNFSAFLTQADFNTGLAGHEPGFETILDVLGNPNRHEASGFLRDDALLVVLVLSNGDDSSKVNMCMTNIAFQGQPPVWIERPCESNIAGKPKCTSLDQYSTNPWTNSCGTYDLSFNHYRNSFRSLKASPELMKLYAAVGDGNKNCWNLGGGSRSGVRYRAMANALGGRDYNICQESVSSVLENLKNDLKATRGSFRTSYLVLAAEPEVSSIQITVYRNGRLDQAEFIPQDEINGWSYIGYMDEVYTIDDPVPMNPASGFVIQLNGSARLLGNDTADVQYQAKGAQESNTQF